MPHRSFDLSDRLLEFAVAVCTVAESHPSSRLGRHVACQLMRSGTAPAANYAEAEGAESRRDFIHKLRVALKELRESLFWLKLTGRMKLRLVSELESTIDECDELVSILVRSIHTARKNGRP